MHDYVTVSKHYDARSAKFMFEWIINVYNSSSCLETFFFSTYNIVNCINDYVYKTKKKKKNLCLDLELSNQGLKQH